MESISKLDLKKPSIFGLCGEMYQSVTMRLGVFGVLEKIFWTFSCSVG